MTDSDEALVVRAQRGDRSAFEELVRRTSRLVFARLYLETGDGHRAEDLVQETLLRAWSSLGSLEKPANLRAWLLTVAKNVLVDAARRDNRQKRSEPPSAGPSVLSLVPEDGPSPDEEAERAELRGQVMDALRSLPEEYQMPLTLRYIAGADYRMIERQLNLSNGSLRGLLHRGLRMLREKLAPEFGDDNGGRSAEA